MARGTRYPQSQRARAMPLHTHTHTHTRKGNDVIRARMHARTHARTLARMHTHNTHTHTNTHKHTHTHAFIFIYRRCPVLRISAAPRDSAAASGTTKDGLGLGFSVEGLGFRV
jgi:hypothetical protein